MKTMLKNWKQKSIKFKKCSRILTNGLLLLINIFLISCASTPPKTDSIQRGEWQARVLVKDLVQSKTVLVNVDFLAAKPNKLRMDATTPLGIHVASLAIYDKKTTYVIPQKKQYYEGPTTSKVFTSILNFSLDPKIIWNVLFDKAVQISGWKCKNDKKGFVAQCERAVDPLKIVWSQRRFQEKTVSITHAEFEIEMKFHHFSSPKQLKDALFTIPQPAGFSKIL